MKSTKRKGGGNQKGSQDYGLPFRVIEGLAMPFSNVAFSKIGGKSMLWFCHLAYGYFVGIGSLGRSKASSSKEDEARPFNWP